jgi:hypothetical protein
MKETLMSERKAPLRKKYEAPQLIVYGDLTEMTKSGGKSGMTDMAKSNSMT